MRSINVKILLFIIPTATFVKADDETVSVNPKLQNPFKMEFAKDVSSMAIESNLGSTCKTNVFIASEECESYVSFVTTSLSQWGSPVFVLKYPEFPETFQNDHSQQQKSWKNALSRFHDPCKLVLICALIPVPDPVRNNGTEDSSIIQPAEQEEIKRRYTEDFSHFLKLFRSIDQILYLSYYDLENPSIIDETDDPAQIQFLKQSEDKILNHTGFLLSVKVKPQNESENSASVFSVFSRCKYCGTEVKKQNLGTWKRNRTLFSNFFQAFEENKKVSFDNYDGFIVGYLEYPPHISCQRPSPEDGISDGDGIIRNCSGVEYEMLKQMGGSLKFLFTLKNFTDKGQQGVIYSSTNISGMIGAVSSYQLDVAVGAISVTPDKLASMDVTDIFTHQPIVEKRNDLYILGIWLAFQPEVWPLILLTIASVAVIIELILRRQRHGSRRSTRSKSNTIQGLEISIKSLLGQPLTSSQFPREARPILKLVLSLWWFACLIISTVYNTNLITSLINPVSPKEPESLKNLLDSGFRFRVVSTKSAVSDLLDKAGDDDDEENYPFREIKSRLIPHDDTNYYHSRSRTAYVVEESAVRVVNWKEKHGFSNIKVINERLFLTGYGWPLRKDAPYKDKFNTAISYLSSAGLIKYWYNTFTHKEKKSTEARFRLQDKIGQVKLDLEVLQGAFIFLVLGCFAAFLTFLYEQISWRYTFRFFTWLEIQWFWHIVVRKVQILDFKQEVTRVGHTGILVIAPLECLPHSNHLCPRRQQRTKFHKFGDKNIELAYLK